MILCMQGIISWPYWASRIFIADLGLGLANDLFDCKGSLAGPIKTARYLLLALRVSNKYLANDILHARDH